MADDQQQTSELHEKALKLYDKSKQTICEHRGVLKADTMQAAEAAEEAATVVKSILNSPGTSPEVRRVVVAMEEAELQLWEAIWELEKRISCMEQEVKQLQQDSDDAMLRSMSHQAENKVYRFCMRLPSGKAPYTPVEVGSAGLKRLAQEPQKPGVFKSLKKKFHNLTIGIEELKDMGNSTAHPSHINDPTTKQDRAVTKDDLQACIKRRHGESILQADFESVLQCLEYLAQQMGEDLFMDLRGGRQ